MFSLKSAVLCRVALFLLAVTALPASAATFTWDGGGGANLDWNNAANWNPDGVPTSATDTIIVIPFTALTAATPLNQNMPTVPFVLNQLTISNTSTNTAGTMSLTGSQIRFAGTAPKMTLTSGVAVDNQVIVSAPLDLAANTVFEANLSGPTTRQFGVTSVLSGSGNLTMNAVTNAASIRFRLEGASPTMTGTITIGANTIVRTTNTNVTQYGATSAGTTVTNGGTLMMFGATVTIGPEPLTISGTGVNGLGALGAYPGAAGQVLTYNGNINLLASSRIRSSNGTQLVMVLNGDITNAAGANLELFVGSVGSIIRLAGDNAAFTGIIGLDSDQATGGTYNLNSPNALGGTTGAINFGADTAGAVQTNTVVNINAETAPRTISRPSNFYVDLAVPAATFDLTFSNAVTLFAGNRTVTVTDAADTINFNGAIGENGGARGLTKAGAGRVIVTGNNTYSGPTAVNAGILNVQSATGLGAAAGGATVAAGAALELQNNIAVGAEALTLNGTGITNGGALRNISGTNSWAGNVALASASLISADAGALSIGGNVTGAFGLDKRGVGIVSLAGAANTYSGPTTVTAGVLQVDGTTTDLGNTFTVASGATLGGAGTIGATVAISAGGFLNPGPFASTGTLSVNSDVGVSGELTIDVNAAAADSLDVTGNLDIAALRFNTIAAPTGNTYVVASYTGTLSGALSISSIPAGYRFVSDTTAKELVLERIPTVSIAGNSSGPESTLTVNVAVTLSNASRLPITVPFSTAGSTATNPSDYTITASPLNFPAGTTSVNIVLSIVNDFVLESPAAETVILTLSAPTNANLGAPTMSTYTINDDDTPGFTVSAPSSTTTSENGGLVTFTVRLNTVPTQPVSIGLSSSDTTEGTVFPPTLNFSGPTSTNPVQVTVTGVNDFIVDGNVPFSINFAPATSADTDYNGQQPASIALANLDDDFVGLTIDSPGGLATGEPNLNDSFTVRLNTIPTQPVTIAVTSSNTGEGTVSPATLTFQPDGTAQTPQTVTVNGVDDPITDGLISYQIQLAASSADPDYNGQPPTIVPATNQDNDSAEIIVSPITGLTTRENGSSASFTIVLSSATTSDVTIAISSTNPAEGVVSTSSILFTPANSMIPQTITITGVDDSRDDGDIAYTIVTGAAVSANTSFNGKDPSDVNVINIDDDAVGVVVVPNTGLATSEAGGTASFTIALTSTPSSSVTIPISSSNTAEGTVNLGLVVFAPTNALTPQTVTVTGVDDALVDGNVSYSIILGVLTSADSGYNGFNPPDVPIQNVDNEKPSFTSNATATPNPALVGQSILFSSGVSPASTVVVWNFGDGTVGSGATISHTYSVPGLYAVTATASVNGGPPETQTIQMFVAADTSGGGNQPGVIGVLVGGSGLDASTGSGAKLTIDHRNPSRSSFEGKLGQIRFQAGIEPKDLLNQPGSLVLGTGTLAQEFFFTLDKRGGAKATGLPKLKFDFRRSSVQFKIAGRPGLADYAETLGIVFTPGVKKGTPKVVRIPSTLRVGNVLLAMTFELKVQQINTASKGVLNK